MSSCESAGKARVGFKCAMHPPQWRSGARARGSRARSRSAEVRRAWDFGVRVIEGYQKYPFPSVIYIVHGHGESVIFALFIERV